MKCHYEDYDHPYANPTIDVHTGDIRQYDKGIDASDVLIMTGASSNHVITALSCVLSCVMHLPLSPLLFVDFGVNQKEMCWLERMFVFIHQFHSAYNTSVAIYYRKYNWTSFPYWMNVKHHHGGYTWKTITVIDALYQWKAVVMWNDAGNYFQRMSLEAVRLARNEGIYIPPDILATYTERFDEKAINFMLEYNYTKPFNRKVGMGSTIYMLFDYRSYMCRKVVIPWLQCAYTRRCMTLKNGIISHKPQGLLTLFLWQYNFTHCNNKLYDYSPHLWTDRIIHTVDNNLLQETVRKMCDMTGINITLHIVNC